MNEDSIETIKAPYDGILYDVDDNIYSYEFYEIVKSNEDHEALIKAQKQGFLSGLLNSLDEHNFTIDDLQAFKGIKAKENRPKMKPRYAYIALDGEEYLWSGQGKIPTKMQEVMKRDGITNKDHYLISDEN